MVEDLLRQYRCQYILADQGYLSNELKKEIGKRRNMVLDTIKKKYERKKTRK